MNLHNDTLAFNKIIESASDYYKINSSLIEKDYYVTLILKDLFASIPYLVFKGGTSLSKCYKLIKKI